MIVQSSDREVIVVSVDPESEAPTVTLPRQRFAGEVVFEETARPVDPAGVPVDVVPGPVWPAPPRFEVNSSSVNPVSPAHGSAEQAVDGIFEQYGPDVARRPVSGGEVQASSAVELGARHAAEDLPPAAEVPMSPLVERLLNDAVRCGACLAVWPCGNDGHAHGPYVPGEDVGASGEPDPLWFREVAEGLPFGSWVENELTRDLRARLFRLDRALVLAEQNVLAAVARCEAETRKLGPARRDERFAALRAELEAVFGAAGSGELVDQADEGAVAAGGVVVSGVDAEHAPNGNVVCEFVVREPVLEGAVDGDGDGPGGDPTGLTVPCDGKCGDASPHDAHLAEGALERLGQADAAQAAGEGAEGVPGGEG